MTRVSEVLPTGTVLVGTTRRHPGRIEILGASTRTYRVRFTGGQHNAKRMVWLRRDIVEACYRVLQQPRGAER